MPVNRKQEWKPSSGLVLLGIVLLVCATVEAATPQSRTRAAASLAAMPTPAAGPAGMADQGSISSRKPSRVLPLRRSASPADAAPAGGPDADRAAAEIDRLVSQALRTQRARLASAARDEDFVRRATFDLVGRVPTPEEIVAYERQPAGERRAQLVDRLVGSPEFARNVARYWRDVLIERATQTQDRAMAEEAFIEWMAQQIDAGRGWDQIAAALITATGALPGEGAAAMIYLQSADPVEVASETSRVFMGVQLQCAQCHDHPYEDYKREQFHQLAAFFPRVKLNRIEDEVTEEVTYEIVSSDPADARPTAPAGNRLYAGHEAADVLKAFDDDGNGKVDANELGGSELGALLARVDRDGDKAMNLEELERALRFSVGQRQSSRGEHLMPDLDAPELPGEVMNPLFFVDDTGPEPYTDDQIRRAWLAAKITSPQNTAFARALVNRVWTELLGQGFYERPDSVPSELPKDHAAALKFLTHQFVASGHDIGWLYRTIARTDAYQRAVRVYRRGTEPPAYASALPVRLRADALFSSLETIFQGGQSALLQQFSRLTGGSEATMRAEDLERPRQMFRRLFHYDPSTPQKEILGSVPQALFMMNSSVLHRLIEAERGTPFASLVATARTNPEAITQIYLLVLGRRPTREEATTCTQYLAAVPDRREALEDILWSLLNSSEFLTRR